jgi:hypothetical protein
MKPIKTKDIHAKNVRVWQKNYDRQGMNFSMGAKSYSRRTILDIVQSRSSSLSGISRMHIIRDMFGPGHSPLVSGAFFVRIIPLLPVRLRSSSQGRLTAIDAHPRAAPQSEMSLKRNRRAMQENPLKIDL